MQPVINIHKSGGKNGKQKITLTSLIQVLCMKKTAMPNFVPCNKSCFHCQPACFFGRENMHKLAYNWQKYPQVRRRDPFL